MGERGCGWGGRQRRASRKDDGVSDPDWQPMWSPFILDSTYTATRSWGPDRAGWGSQGWIRDWAIWTSVNWMDASLLLVSV